MKHSRKIQKLHELQITRSLKLDKAHSGAVKRPSQPAGSDAASQTESDLK